MKEENFLHKSIMLDEVLSILNPSKNETYIDCTLGAGGGPFPSREGTRLTSSTNCCRDIRIFSLRTNISLIRIEEKLQ